jgi:hypothetical protein
MISVLRAYNYKIWFKLSVYVFLYLILFFVTLQYQTVCELGKRSFAPTSLKTFIDLYTPVNIYIMWPYIACLMYVPISGLFFVFYRKISAFQIIGFYSTVLSVYILNYLIYIFFPTTAIDVMLTSYETNEKLFINKGMFLHLQDLYNISTPFGDFPSLHVSPLVILSLFLYKYWRLLFWIYIPFGFLGAIGTFVLKFHTFAGFFGGIIIGVVVYDIIYKRLFAKYLAG